MHLGINGKYALVTGGTHGIGKAIALSLAIEGCHVAVFSRTEECVEKMRNELSAIDGNHLCFVSDVLDEDGYQETYNEIEKVWPEVIFADTMKSKVVSFIGNRIAWHHTVLKDSQYRSAYN